MYNKDLIKYINEICEIDTNSINIKNIEKDFYTISLTAFNGEHNKNIEYEIKMEYSFELDEDEDGVYVDSIYTHLGYFSQLKKDKNVFSEIHSKIWNEICNYIEENLI